MNRDQAICFLKGILELCAVSKKEVLMKLYLYGSVNKNGMGNDLDAIFEVSEDAYAKYCVDCVNGLDGINPISDVLLIPFHGLRWNYFSPKEARTRAAFQIIGLDLEAFMSDMTSIEKLREIGLMDLDIICLPKGWDIPGSDVRKKLDRTLMGSPDPNFLIRAFESATNITA